MSERKEDKMREYYLVFKNTNDCLAYDEQIMLYVFGSPAIGDMDWIKNSWTKKEIKNLPEWIDYLIWKGILVKELSSETYSVFGRDIIGFETILIKNTGQGYVFINCNDHENDSKKYQYTFTRKELSNLPVWIDGLHDSQMIEYKKWRKFRWT